MLFGSIRAARPGPLPLSRKLTYLVSILHRPCASFPLPALWIYSSSRLFLDIQAFWNSKISPSVLCPSSPKCPQGIDQLSCWLLISPSTVDKRRDNREGLWVSPWPGGLLTLSFPESPESCLGEFCLSERTMKIYT